ncbi:MAG: peptidoglycan DD-metalloendopeptidase family protein [Arcobacteraceae bacterium]|jgi:murein DD-endopeptidase MepM/ murein hydrolase activator NlpD|nr:peptidoglycan DD-metalloendopeptidase family protein [Arcobacteraceae bacterium]
MNIFFKYFTISVIACSISIYANVKNIDEQINKNKDVLEESQNIESETNIKIQLLAKEIVVQNNELQRVSKDVNELEKLISNDQHKLSSAKEEIALLKKNADTLLQDKKNQEEAIVSTIINEFAISLGIQHSSNKTIEELIDKEMYSLLLENSLEEIKKLDVRYLQITQNQEENQKQIEKLQSFIDQNEKKRKELAVLLKKQEQNVASLELKHKEYQAQLKSIIDKQNELNSLLQKLNILKKEESKKEQEKALAAKKAEEDRQKRVQDDKSLAYAPQNNNGIKSTKLENVDFQVKQIGSSVKGVETTRYKGAKTIPPLSSYNVVKKFGKYHDPIYKIELFNDSITMTPKTVDTKVYSVLNGKVVYIKTSANSSDNTIIIEHANGLHTVYSNLEQISPTIEQNKLVKQGYAIGRVKDSLIFQAIINSAFINPVELFGN